MQASELLHDLLGYDDELEHEHEQEQEHYDSEYDHSAEYPFFTDEFGDITPTEDLTQEVGEHGESIEQEFYSMMQVQEQQHDPTNIKSWKYVISTDVNENECSICLMEEELTGLSCSHRFCKDCLSFHVKTQIRSRNVQHIRCFPRKTKHALEIHIETLFGVACPHIGCNYVMQDLVPFVNQQDLHLFDNKCLDIAILKMRLLGELQPCPRRCGYIVQENCLCVNEVCRKRQLWFMKLDARQKEAVLFKEKLAMRMTFPHDKKCCPKCYVEISKNGGCDHMQCSMCDTHFSWSAAPEYGLSYTWFKEQTQKLFREQKIVGSKSTRFYILSASPFKKRKYFAELERSKRKNKEENSSK